MQRSVPLVDGEIYHVFNKSIANYVIFNEAREYERFKQMLLFFNFNQNHLKFAHFQSSKIAEQTGFYKPVIEKMKDCAQHTEIVAYCIMPTHYHLILKQVGEAGISTYLGNLQNSYARFFNNSHGRKGPLWVGKFKNVLVKTDEQLVHLSRYVHLNPVKANLCKKAAEWGSSSYAEYTKNGLTENLCTYSNYIDLNSSDYEKFVDEYGADQKATSLINTLMLD
ncbi:MAG: putative transposase [Candidatus Omnitrophota bacterium]|jgi:putative transposase